MIDNRTAEEIQACKERGAAKAAELRKQLTGKGSSKVSKRCAGHFTKVAELQAVKGPAAVGARAELRKMREVYYVTQSDPYHPSAGAAWQPDGSRQARGSQGRAKKLLSGHNAKAKQGLNIGRR